MQKPSSGVDTISDTTPEQGPRAAPATPRWVTALDIIALVLLVLVLRALLGSGTRIFIGDMRLSFTSWPRVMIWAAVALALRHALWRRVLWHHRILDWARWLVRREPLRAAWAPFIVSRLLVLVVAYIAVVTIGFSTPRSPAVQHDILDLYARFDAAWYHDISRFGYAMREFDPTKQHAIAFFPGLPLLIQTVYRALDTTSWSAGVIIVIATFLGGLAYLYRLAREDLPEDQAKAALMFIAFYPFAVCYSAVLTEAPFLLIVAALFLHVRRRQFVKAAPFALFAGLLRPNGFLLSIPVALTGLIPFARGRGWLPRAAADTDARWQPLLATFAIALLPVAGMLSYCAYVYSMTGDPFAWMKAQQAWGRSSMGILGFIEARRDLIAAFGWTAYPRSFPIEIFEACAALFALAAVWPISRRFGLPYGLFVALSVLPPLITLGSISLGRYTAPLFPIFLWLGATVPPERRPYWIAAFAGLQALVATLFFTGRAPY